MTVLTDIDKNDFIAFMYDCGYDVNRISLSEVEIATFYDICECDEHVSYQGEFCPIMLKRDAHAWNLFEVLCIEPVLLAGQIERVEVRGQEVMKSACVYKINDIRINDDLYDIWIGGGIIVDEGDDE